MAPVTATVSIRYAIMAIILVTAYFTVHAQAQNARRTLNREKANQISQYVNENIHKSLESIQNHNTTLKKRINIPRIEGGHRTSLNCWDGRVLVNVSGRTPVESSVRLTDLDCGKVNASGEIIPGERCLMLEKEDQDTINMEITNYCTI